MKNIYRPYECDICHSTDISVTTEYKDYTSKIVKYTKINEEVERFERSRIEAEKRKPPVFAGGWM